MSLKSMCLKSAVFVLAFSFPAASLCAASDSLQSCAHIQDDRARLLCFDQALEQNIQSAEAAGSVVPKHCKAMNGDWNPESVQLKTAPKVVAQMNGDVTLRRATDTDGQHHYFSCSGDIDTATSGLVAPQLKQVETSTAQNEHCLRLGNGSQPIKVDAPENAKVVARFNNGTLLKRSTDTANQTHHYHCTG